MNTNKLAEYVGVPRSTMDLEELERSAESSEGAQPGSNLYAYHVKVVRNTNSRVKSERKGSNRQAQCV